MTRARETSENARQAKAWVWGSGYGSYGVRSFNITSIVDTGSDLGQYKLNFENNMDSANYVVLVNSSIATDGRFVLTWPNLKTVSSVDIYAYPVEGTQAYIDWHNIDMVVYE